MVIKSVLYVKIIASRLEAYLFRARSRKWKRSDLDRHSTQLFAVNTNTVMYFGNNLRIKLQLSRISSISFFFLKLTEWICPWIAISERKWLLEVSVIATFLCNFNTNIIIIVVSQYLFTYLRRDHHFRLALLRTKFDFCPQVGRNVWKLKKVEKIFHFLVNLVVCKICK